MLNYYNYKMLAFVPDFNMGGCLLKIRLFSLFAKEFLLKYIAFSKKSNPL